MQAEMIKQFLESLTDAQSQELRKLTTPNEVLAFAERVGTPLSREGAERLAEEISDEAMASVTGGMKSRQELERERKAWEERMRHSLL